MTALSYAIDWCPDNDDDRKDTDQFELLDTAFVNSLDSHLFTFITVSNSYPVFLSAVTQDLFEKQTMYASVS